MKRTAQERIYEEMKGMTTEQRLDYRQLSFARLQAKQSDLRAQLKLTPPRLVSERCRLRRAVSLGSVNKCSLDFSD